MHIKNFSFANILKENIPLLYSWLNEPHVSKWWPTPKKDEPINEFLQRIRSIDTGYLVLLNSIPIGYIQYYKINRNEKSGAWLPELPQNTIGIDQFIGDKNLLGKGYGALFIKEFINYLSNSLEPILTTVIVDPEPHNIAAIKCYEKVGFINMGIYDRRGEPAQLLRYDINSK